MPGRWPSRAGRSASRRGCRAEWGNRARRRSGCPPCSSSPNRDSRAPHGSGRIACHGVNPAVAGAGTRRHHGGGLGRQPIQPFTGGHRLIGGGVVAEPAPVAFVLELLVRDGSLDDQDERLQFISFGLEEPRQEIVGAPARSALEVDQGPMDGDLGQTGKRPRAISSMLGWVAAVNATESPSQLRPALIHSTWISASSADCCLGWHRSQLSGARADGPNGSSLAARGLLEPQTPG